MTAATHRPLRHTSTAWSRRRAPQSGLILSRRTRTYDRVMARFANAQAEWSTLEFLWLAGLLEAEGTFLRPPPSSPRSPQVVCRMTDRDVFERVADRFGTSVFSVDKGQYRTVNSATSSRSRSAGGTRCIRARPSAQSTAEGDSVSSLARSFGVARQTIHRILKREIYWAPPPRPWRDKATMLPDPAYL